jgi:outer membrane immunogenic protein
MKAIAGLVAATLLFAGSAVEASPWVAEVAPLVPEFTWTGCYLGLSIGGVWADQTVASSGSVVGNQAQVGGALGGASGIVGVYGGCNWQFAGTWVLGVEGEYNWAEIRDISTAPNLFLNGAPVGSGGINWSHDLDRIGSVRGRLGYAVKPNVLLFVAGGIAWEHSSFTGLDAGTRRFCCGRWNRLGTLEWGLDRSDRISPLPIPWSDLLDFLWSREPCHLPLGQ